MGAQNAGAVKPFLTVFSLRYPLFFAGGPRARRHIALLKRRFWFGRVFHSSACVQQLFAPSASLHFVFGRFGFSISVANVPASAANF